MAEQVKRKRDEGEGRNPATAEQSQVSEESPKLTPQLEEQPAYKNDDPDMGKPDEEGPPAATSAVHNNGLGMEPSGWSLDTEQSAPTHTILYYLHHPSLPSKHPVLIPLSPVSILATALTNRLVLEFPTIYALPQQQNGGLPDGFISEEEFFATSRKDLVKDVMEPETSIPSIGAMAQGIREEPEEGEVDEGRLLDVLGKDLKGLEH